MFVIKYIDYKILDAVFIFCRFIYNLHCFFSFKSFQQTDDPDKRTLGNKYRETFNIILIYFKSFTDNLNPNSPI